MFIMNGFEFCHCQCHLDDRHKHIPGIFCCTICSECGKNIRIGYMSLHRRNSCIVKNNPVVNRKK